MFWTRNPSGCAALAEGAEDQASDACRSCLVTADRRPQKSLCRGRPPKQTIRWFPAEV